MRFELTTPTLARLCSTPELRPRSGLVAQASKRAAYRRGPRCLQAPQRRWRGVASLRLLTWSTGLNSGSPGASPRK